MPAKMPKQNVIGQFVTIADLKVGQLGYVGDYAIVVDTNEEVWIRRDCAVVISANDGHPIAVHRTAEGIAIRPGRYNWLAVHFTPTSHYEPVVAIDD